MAVPEKFWNQFTAEQLRGLVERRMKITPGSLAPNLTNEELVRLLSVPNPLAERKPKVNIPPGKEAIILSSPCEAKRAAIVRSLFGRFLPIDGGK